MAFGVMIFSQEATIKIKVERIALERAMQNKTICKAMYEQLDIKEVLHGERVKYYTAIVKANDRVYLVYGKYMEWLNFFYQLVNLLIDSAFQHSPFTLELRGKHLDNLGCGARQSD